MAHVSSDSQAELSKADQEETEDKPRVEQDMKKEMVCKNFCIKHEHFYENDTFKYRSDRKCIKFVKVAEISNA